MAQVDMPDVYTDYVIEALQGDILRFNYNSNNPLADGTFFGVRMVDQAGCPLDYVRNNREFCIKNKELCIENEELCIKNKEFRI